MISSVVSVEDTDESTVDVPGEQAVANRNTLIRQVRILTMDMSVWIISPFLTVSLDKVRLFSPSCRGVSMQIGRWVDKRQLAAVFVLVFTDTDFQK